MMPDHLMEMNFNLQNKLGQSATELLDSLSVRPRISS